MRTVPCRGRARGYGYGLRVWVGTSVKVQGRGSGPGLERCREHLHGELAVSVFIDDAAADSAAAADDAETRGDGRRGSKWGGLKGSLADGVYGGVLMPSVWLCRGGGGGGGGGVGTGTSP